MVASSIIGSDRWYPILLFLALAVVLYLVVWQSFAHLERVEMARLPCGRPAAQVARGLCARYELRYFDEQLAGWLWFDTGWYISIARDGYSDAQVRAFKEGRQSAVAFFPAYPLIVRQVNRLVDSSGGGHGPACPREAGDSRWCCSFSTPMRGSSSALATAMPCSSS